MLLYSGVSPVVDGVVVFRDHADDTTYYYLPAVPELARTTDGRPAFGATAFLPAASVSSTGPDAAATRATLWFDVELPVPEPTKDAIRDVVRDVWDGDATHLVPAPLRSGTAYLELPRPGEATKDVVVYQGHAPSLLGTCRAALAVAASGEEARMLMAAVAGGDVAGVMSYSLEFLGLAPSFRASMHVRWSEVYRYLRDLSSTNFVFAADEIDKVTEDLRRHQLVDITVQELDPDGASAATAALFTELKSQVVAKLFEPPRQLGDVPIEDRIGRGVRNVLVALMPGVTHTLRTMDASQLVDTTVDLSEQRAHVYPAYAQSSLAGLLDRAGGVGDRVRWIRMDQLPGLTEEVAVELAPGAGRLGVRRVEVQVRAEQAGQTEPLLDRTVVLDAAATTPTTLSFRRVSAEQPVLRYRAEVRLDPAVAPLGRERWALDWREVTGGRVYLDAEDLLDVEEVTVEIDDPAVLDGGTSVALTVEALLDGETEPFSRTDVVFGAATLSHRVSAVVPDGHTVRFRAREVFRRTGEPDFARDVGEIEGIHRVRNPFGQHWVMEIHATADWSATEALAAELRVRDAERDVWVRTKGRFTRDAPVWTAEVDVSPSTPRAAEIRLSRIGTDGSVVRGPWQDVVGDVVPVSDDVRAERRIRVRLHAPRWAQDDVRRVTVDLRIGEGPAAATQALVLTGDGATADWTHPFPDPSRPGYGWKARAVGVGGERWSGQWGTSAADDLEVTLPDPLWS